MTTFAFLLYLFFFYVPSPPSPFKKLQVSDKLKVCQLLVSQTYNYVNEGCHLSSSLSRFISGGFNSIEQTVPNKLHTCTETRALQTLRDKVDQTRTNMHGTHKHMQTDIRVGTLRSGLLVFFSSYCACFLKQVTKI